MRSLRPRSILIALALAVAGSLVTQNISLALSKEFMYDNGNKRDPFLSLIDSDVQLSDVEDLHVGSLRLEGIIFDPLQGSYAVINGEVYRTSEFVRGFEIIEIGENYIKVSQENVLHTVQIPSDEP